jgi:predicted house-cleaning NTP pyrophosphatase (Maf/HAM1 superfamily)
MPIKCNKSNPSEVFLEKRCFRKPKVSSSSQGMLSKMSGFSVGEFISVAVFKQAL